MERMEMNVLYRKYKELRDLIGAEALLEDLQILTLK